MERLSALQIALAAAAWGWAALRELDESERLEWLLAGMLLNAAALALWNGALGPVAALDAWLRHALPAAAATLLLHLVAALHLRPTYAWRRVFAPASYGVFTLGLLLLSPAARAADKPPPDLIPVQPLHQESPPAPAQEATAPVQLAPVVVTGELLKREDKHTTASVVVKHGIEVERSTVRDVYELIRATPNVTTSDNSFGYGSMTIRGVPSYGPTDVGGAYIYSSASSIVLDGVGLPRAAQAYGDLSAFDLDSVEIFRGPQSTSQGRNAMAGAVLVNTAQPLLSDVAGLESVQGRVRLSGSDRAGYQGAGAFDVTPWADQLGLRLGTDHRATRGDIHNITRNEDDWARDGSHGLRLRTLWQPDGADGRYRALLGAHDLRRFIGSRYVEQSHERQREATADEESHTRAEARLFSLDQGYELNDQWQLRAISAYVRSQTDSVFDLDYSAEQTGVFRLDQPARAFSQELRGSYEGEVLRGTVGLYYFDGRDDDAGDVRLDANAALRAGGLCNPALLCTAPLGNILATLAIPTRIEDAAVFGELDWQVIERLTLTAGLRYDREHSRRTFIVDNRGDTPQAQAAITLLQTAGVLGPNGATPVERRFSTMLPKLAAVYEVTDGWFAGASYSQGYRPGGDGYNTTTGRRFSFDAEYTRNYELSLKGGYRPWRLDAALHLFHTDWDDMQVETGSGIDVVTENAGQSEIDGGELELRFKPWRPLRVIAGLGITDGRFKEYRSSRGDFSGNRLPKAPKRSATLALEWQATPDLLIRPDVVHTGSTSAHPDNGPGHELPAHTLLNLSLRWQQGPFALFFSGSNLTDRFYRTDALTTLYDTEVAALGAARRLTAGLDFQFH